MPSVKRLLLICSSVLLIGSAQAEHGPTTFVGPTLQGSYTGWFSPTSAYSALAEVGVGNYRINLTAGSEIDYNQRVKFSAEYLWQDIYYQFTSGKTREWMQQVAAGLDYQYLFGCDRNYGFNFNVWAAKAPSKTLPYRVYDVVIDGVPTTAINDRRVAGSLSWGVAPGMELLLWQGGDLGIDLNYDSVHYNKTYVPNYHATGIGGTIYFSQLFGDHFRVRLLGAKRKPFYNFQGSLAYENYYYKGRWNVGLFGSYVNGRVQLPNTWNAGISLNYFADCTPAVMPNLKGDLKGEHEVLGPVNREFLNWVSDPAVYLPQVLAIPDEQVTVESACLLPLFVAQLPDVTEFSGPPISILTAQAFSGTNLTFSAVGLPTGLSINPVTGEITGIVLTGSTITALVTVTATNSCASVSDSFVLTIIND